MRDSLGGAVNVFIIVIFIVFALGYMAYNVNYTKAFRMKNKIVFTYEKYKGKCLAACQEEIKSYADSIGYRPDTLGCGNHQDPNKLYCVFALDANSISDMKHKCYYRIVTKININLPIFQNMMKIEGNDPNHVGPKGISVFYVWGDTKAIELEGGSTNC